MEGGAKLKDRNRENLQRISSNILQPAKRPRKTASKRDGIESGSRRKNKNQGERERGGKKAMQERRSSISKEVRGERERGEAWKV